MRPSIQMRASREWQIAAADIAQQQDALMERRRTERAAHQHKQIWTKHPHGGPYRKVSGQVTKLSSVERSCRLFVKDRWLLQPLQWCDSRSIANP